MKLTECHFLKRWRKHRLRPVWIARLDGMDHAIQGDGRLFVVQGLRGQDTSKPRETWLPTAISIYEVDCRTGALHLLEGSTQQIEWTTSTGLGLHAASRLYVNYGNRIVGWDFQNGLHWHQYRSIEGATVVASPLVENGNLICLWQLAHGGARVSISSIDDAPGSFRASEILEKEAYHPIIWTGSSLLVAMRKGTRYDEPPEPEKIVLPKTDRLYILDPSSLKIQALEDIPTIVGRREAVLFENGQLFYASERNIQIEPEGEWHEVTPEETDTEGRPQGVTGWKDAGTKGFPWLTCYSIQERKPIKSWRIMGQCEILTSAPGHPGIIVTTRFGVFLTSIEVLLNSRPRPAPIGTWEGEAVCAPTFVNGRGYWLSDCEGLSWLEASEQEERGEQPLPLRLYDTQIHMLDFSTGEHRAIALRFGDRGKFLLLHDTLIIIQTATMLIAYKRDDLWAVADSVRSEGLSSVVRAFQHAGRSAPLKGALFSGPLSEDWGYHHEDATLHEILDGLLESPAEFWSSSLSDRLKATTRLTDNLVHSVLTYWPDTIGKQAKLCPDDLFSFALAVHQQVDEPFGRLPPNRALTDRILSWRHQAEANAGVLPPGAAELIARFLLHEHIRRCINMIAGNKVIDGWRDRHLIDSRSAREIPPALEAAFAWYSLECIDSSLAARFLKTFVTRWSEGPPVWEGDVGPFMEFLRDCARWGLLCQPARNSLAEAVSRAWSSALNSRRKSVFISYSHKQEELAHGLAAGLEQRGLRVALDRWEIGVDSQDHAVETWIAETTVSTEVKIFVLSSEALLSGWVNREIEWELRLLGVRRAMSLPYVLIVEKSTPLSLDAYPRSRVVLAADLEGLDGAVLDELTLRIALDGVLQLQTVKDRVLWGLPM